MSNEFNTIKSLLKDLSDKELSELDVLLWAELNKRDPSYFSYYDDEGAKVSEQYLTKDKLGRNREDRYDDDY